MTDDTGMTKPVAQRPRLVKLVRDRIGEFLGGTEVSYDPVPDDEYLPSLRRKLIEDSVEYVLDPTIGELADLYEVLCCVADAEGFGMPAVVSQAGRKASERGGFWDGIGMYVQTTAQPRDGEQS